MKKFGYGIASFILGALLFSSVSVLANGSNLVTATVENFNILINGKKIELEQQPITVEGRSYLPVRSISNALGFEVKYDEKSRTISLSDDGKDYLPKSNEDEAIKSEVKTPVENTGKTQTTNNESGGIINLKDKYTTSGEKMDVGLIKSAIAKKEITVDSFDADTGDTLVILAIKENNYELYKYLVQNKADVEKPNFEGQTPIHIAVIIKSGFYMAQLTNHQYVNTRVKDNYGKMPIDYTEEESDDYRFLRSASN